MKKNLILMTALFAGAMFMNDGICGNQQPLEDDGRLIHHAQQIQPIEGLAIIPMNGGEFAQLNDNRGHLINYIDQRRNNQTRNEYINRVIINNLQLNANGNQNILQGNIENIIQEDIIVVINSVESNELPQQFQSFNDFKKYLLKDYSTNNFITRLTYIFLHKNLLDILEERENIINIINDLFNSYQNDQQDGHEHQVDPMDGVRAIEDVQAIEDVAHEDAIAVDMNIDGQNNNQLHVNRSTKSYHKQLHEKVRPIVNFAVTGAKKTYNFFKKTYDSGRNLARKYPKTTTAVCTTAGTILIFGAKESIDLLPYLKQSQ